MNAYIKPNAQIICFYQAGVTIVECRYSFEYRAMPDKYRCERFLVVRLMGYQESPAVVDDDLRPSATKSLVSD